MLGGPPEGFHDFSQIILGFYPHGDPNSNIGRPKIEASSFRPNLNRGARRIAANTAKLPEYCGSHRQKRSLIVMMAGNGAVQNAIAFINHGVVGVRLHLPHN
jgi:hypothetical protein